MPRAWWPLVLLAGAARAAGAQARPDPTPGPPPIQDNSFLVEEAYTQDRGVVQHVATFARPASGPGWVATFAEEWPVGGSVHQLSYAAAEVHPDAAGAAPRLGDLALKYRYRALAHRGVRVAPRATVVLPTGSARAGAGAGGVGLQAGLPLTLELSPHWATHTNLNGEFVPRGHAEDGAVTRSANLTLAQSVVWLARPTFNVLLETLWSHTATRAAGQGVARETEAVVSPGVRYAFNRASGMQVVPGLAAPVTFTGSLRRAHAEAGVFAYFSVEHAFGRTH